MALHPRVLLLGLLVAACTSNATGLVPTPVVFAIQPTTTSAGGAIIPAVQVVVQDAKGNTVTSATTRIILSLGENPGGGTLSGTTTVAAVAGVATFPGLSINKAGTGYTLTAGASDLTGATSSAFNILVGAPSQLAFTVEPSNGALGAETTPAVQVAVQNALGNTVPTATNAITLAIGTNPGSGTLAGVTTAPAVNGVASFATLHLSPAATGYTLTASAAGLASTTSNAFSIVAPLGVGEGYTCGVTTTDTPYCWGENGFGELGDDTTAGPQQCLGEGSCSTTPVTVAGGLTFAAVSSGNLQSCAITSSGVAYCWGYNPDGELGNGTTANSTAPVAVSGGLTFASVSAGTNQSCGVTTGGAAYCWGYNAEGQLGTGTTTSSTTPVAVSGGLTFASLSTGGAHTCGVTTGGAAYCWGYDPHGELGNGTYLGPDQCAAGLACSTAPVAVAGGLTFAAVSVGEYHTCGVTTSGTVYCWGLNDYGALGDSASTGPQQCLNGTPCSTVPIAISGGLTFASVSAGDDYACGVTSSGGAYCWGANTYGGTGVLGNGTTADSPTPVPVSGGLTFAVVGAEVDHTCGVTPNGAAYCWGDNNFGELGNGTTWRSAD